jgi:hypothetical protein
MEWISKISEWILIGSVLCLVAFVAIRYVIEVTPSASNLAYRNNETVEWKREFLNDIFMHEYHRHVILALILAIGLYFSLKSVTIFFRFREDRSWIISPPQSVRNTIRTLFRKIKTMIMIEDLRMGTN